MRFHDLPTAFLALAGVVQSAALDKRDLLQDLQDQAIEALKGQESSGAVVRRSCSLSSASVRKDWYVN